MTNFWHHVLELDIFSEQSDTSTSDIYISALSDHSDQNLPSVHLESDKEAQAVKAFWGQFSALGEH